MNAILHTSPKDNLVTCLRHLTKGELVQADGRTYEVRDDIPQFHKMAVADIKAGDPVFKYGQVIGRATKDISVGEHAHIHNIESMRGRGDKREQHKQND